MDNAYGAATKRLRTQRATLMVLLQKGYAHEVVHLWGCYKKATLTMDNAYGAATKRLCSRSSTLMVRSRSSTLMGLLQKDYAHEVVHLWGCNKKATLTMDNAYGAATKRLCA
jgi:ABC-type ATPase with predicted acetyltransferase domain